MIPTSVPCDRLFKGSEVGAIDGLAASGTLFETIVLYLLIRRPRHFSHLTRPLPSPAGSESKGIDPFFFNNGEDFYIFQKF